MLSLEERRALEAEVKRLCDGGDFDAALDRTLRGYGPEIRGYLVALHDGVQDAQEVLSLWREDVWKGLPGFKWRSSLRGWCYVLARHASHRYRESPRTPYDPLSSSVLDIPQEDRPPTGSFLGADKRDKLARMRAELPPEDREMLVLRLDRELPWDEIARVTLGDEALEDEAAIVRESARLRQRFRLVTKELIEQGQAEEMIEKKPKKDDDGDDGDRKET